MSCQMNQPSNAARQRSARKRAFGARRRSTRRRFPVDPAQWEAVIAGAPGKDRPLTEREEAKTGQADVGMMWQNSTALLVTSQFRQHTTLP